MLIRVFLAITMPVADVHGDICAQNDTSPTLCEAPAAWGVGYFYFIFRCSCLQGFNPHPVLIAKLPFNLAWVQLAGSCLYGESGRLRRSGAGQGRPYTGVQVPGELAESLWWLCSRGYMPKMCHICATSLNAMLQSSAVEAHHTRIRQKKWLP